MLPPTLETCQVTQFTVNDLADNLEVTDTGVYDLWQLTNDGYPDPLASAANGGTNTVTLHDPKDKCEPAVDVAGLTEVPRAWCPPYADFLGGVYYAEAYVSDGNVTYVSDGTSLVIPIAEDTAFQFSADDQYGTGGDATAVSCTFHVHDDIPPEWTGCGTLDTSTYTKTLDLETSALLEDPSDPASSSWDWGDTSVQNVVKGLFNESLPMPQDNTNAAYMNHSAASELTQFLQTDTFLRSDGVDHFLYDSNSAYITVTDASLNTATCDITYTLVDNVAPVVECTSSTTITYSLLGCDSATWTSAGSDPLDPKKGCDHTIAYDVHEDVSLLPGFCTVFTFSNGCDAGSEVSAANLKSKTHAVSEPLTTSGYQTVVPPYIDDPSISSPTSTDQQRVRTLAQAIYDWSSNQPAEDCSTTITILDNVPPVALHGLEDNSVAYGGGATASDQCYSTMDDAADVQQNGEEGLHRIRLLEGTSALDLPYAVLPAPWARDAAHLSVEVTREQDNAATATTTETGASAQIQLDHSLRDDLGVGTYNFTYRYFDSSANERSCHWQVRVYAPYEEPNATVFTVQYYANQGGSGSRRRRAVLSGGDPPHALRTLLQAPPAFPASGSSLTLQYVISATYPYVPKDAGTISTNTSGTDGDYGGIEVVTSENCGENGVVRSYSDPEDGGSWGDDTGVCFKTYQISKSGIDCDLLSETVTIQHALECVPAATDHHYHYDPQTSLKSADCVDEDSDQVVTIAIAAQDFCYAEITTVALQVDLYLGSESWAQAIMAYDSGGTGSYWSADLAGQTQLVNQEASDPDTMKVCAIALLRVPGQEVGSVQFDSVQFTSVTYNTTTHTPGNTSTLPPNTYTNMIGFCEEVTIPPLAFNEDATHDEILSVTVEGTVDYNLNGVSRRRSILYEENADFQVSEVYSFTATRGADDDPFFTPNTDAASDGSKPAASWALPVGLALLFLLCLCAGCTFMGYKSCLWAKDVVLQNGNLKSVPLPELPGPSSETELARLHPEENPPALSLSTLGARAEVYTDENETPW